MATNNQSQIQSLLEGLTSVNANAQNAQPTQPNNGNPNMASNVNITNPVNMIPAQSNAAGNWWIPDTGSGVNMQAVLATLPRNSNPLLDNILANLTRPPAGAPPGGPGTGNPGPGTPPVVQPPGGPGPGGYVPPGGIRGPGRPVGPISGPIHDDPLSWRDNYNNAMPNTNPRDSGLGREGALPWLTNPAFRDSGLPSTGDGALDGLGRFLSGLVNTIGGAFNPDEIMSDIREFVGDITLQNGWQGALRQVLNSFLPGAGNLIPRQPEETTAPDPAMEAQITQRLRQQLGGLIQGITERSGASAQQRLDSFLNSSRQSAQRLYDSAPQMNQQEYQSVLERLGFVDWFNSGGAHDIGTNNMREAEEWTVRHRDKWRRRR